MMTDSIHNSFSSLRLAKAPSQLVQDPSREIRAGAILIGIFVVGLAGWSSFVRLDAAIQAPGIVRVAGNRQTVQSAAGGVISAIHVKEGNAIKAGQILIEMASTEAMAQERTLASRIFGLQAENARLTAVRLGLATVPVPDEWAALSPEDQSMALQTLAAEQSNLDASRDSERSERNVMSQRVQQLRQQITGSNERLLSSYRQSSLYNDELVAARSMLEKGYTTKPRVLALERSKAAMAGEIGSTSSEIARLNTSIGETRMQMMQSIADRRQQEADRSRAAKTELQGLLPQWQAARRQLELTRVRAPVSGAVLGLAANTIGGVIAPGGRVMDIVPFQGTLEIETQVPIDQANELRAGQDATVEINVTGNHNLPKLHGKVSRVAEDSLTDSATQRSFYTFTVSVPRTQLESVSKAAGLGRIIRQGTPVSVSVPLQRRTALQYWFQPLLRRFNGALSER